VFENGFVQKEPALGQHAEMLCQRPPEAAISLQENIYRFVLTFNKLLPKSFELL
jgi:hypothetical protein